MTDIDPRIEADAQIARALQIVCDACDKEEQPNRDYTPDELETLFFALGMAMVQLAKLPGGKEARERFYHNAQDQLAKRGRTDILKELADHKNRLELAKTYVRKAFGENVDFAPGTSGYAMAKVVELELDQLDELRVQLAKLAETMTY